MPKSLYSPRHDKFRRLLVDARRQAGLTQAALAEELSRPQSYVSKFERGERRLDVIEFLEVAAALKVDPTRFIRRLIADRGGTP